jgi:hypothetical protein
VVSWSFVLCPSSHGLKLVLSHDTERIATYVFRCLVYKKLNKTNLEVNMTTPFGSPMHQQLCAALRI